MKKGFTLIELLVVIAILAIPRRETEMGSAKEENGRG